MPRYAGIPSGYKGRSGELVPGRVSGGLGEKEVGRLSYAKAVRSASSSTSEEEGYVACEWKVVIVIQSGKEVLDDGFLLSKMNIVQSWISSGKY